MSTVAEEMRSYLGAGSDILAHYGKAHDENPPGRGSGRYPWGSGKVAYQHIGQEFLDEYAKLRRSGMSDSDIAKEWGILNKEGKPAPTVIQAMHRAAVKKVAGQKATQAKELFQNGKTYSEIAEILGVSPGTAKAYVVGNHIAQYDIYESLANDLKKIIDERGIIDVGEGTARMLEVPQENLNAAFYILESQGYNYETYRLHQSGNANREITYAVMGPPEATKEELRDPANLHSIEDYVSRDNGETLKKAFAYPESLDSSRVMIRYAEDNGTEKDGVLEIRRGLDDLNLGLNNYAQVRILVDGTHYIKGMAVYGDNMPDGVDAIFNTNKSSSKPMMGYNEDGTPNDKGVLKPIDTKDPNNPFGSSIKPFEKGGQTYWTDEYGEEHLGLVNKRADAGDWEDWSKTLPSQFLSKQPQELVQKQLNLSVADKRAELEDICSIPNPTLRKQMLQDFAGACDTASYKLNAAAFPNQAYQVLLPVVSMPETQVYAPNYKDGTKLALVRFPHAGQYEIPILTVNNKNPEAIRVIGKNAIDAVGINAKVASVLSGADFDGDAVIAIPLSEKVRVKAEKAIKELQEFDPHKEYAIPEGKTNVKRIKTEAQKGKEMGIISNLITDMHMQGAPVEHLIRATKHSMVVIDALKHDLDYKRSEEENGIEELKRIYQQQPDSDKVGGAASLLSRAKSPVYVTKRQGSGTIDPETGNVTYRIADDAYYKDRKTGKIKKRTQQTYRMLEEDNAYNLLSNSKTGTRNPIERYYADYANSLKDLAREARKIYANTPNLKKDNNAYKVYQGDVDELMAQVYKASKNQLRERQANAIANAETRAYMKAWNDENPKASNTERNKARKKFEDQAIKRAREQVGSKRTKLVLTDRQWEAMNSGAIGVENQKLVLKYVDREDLIQRSRPKTWNQLSDAKVAQIKAKAASGYTNAEIAEMLGCSKTTVIKYLSGKGE